jgi:hypothetical protein
MALKERDLEENTLIPSYLSGRRWGVPCVKDHIFCIALCNLKSTRIAPHDITLVLHSLNEVLDPFSSRRLLPGDFCLPEGGNTGDQRLQPDGPVRE